MNVFLVEKFAQSLYSHFRFMMQKNFWKIPGGKIYDGTNFQAVWNGYLHG